MSTPQGLLDYVRSLPGRCQECGWHIEKMGHQPSCGDVQREQAFAQLDAGKDAETENALLRREIVALGHRKMEFTPDDLPQSVRESTNPNRRGRVFAQLVDDRVVCVVGKTKSRNPKAHGKDVNIYRLRVGP